MIPEDPGEKPATPPILEKEKAPQREDFEPAYNHKAADLRDKIKCCLSPAYREKWEETEKLKAKKEKLKAKRKLGDSSAREKARFLLTHYCYTLRNKTFHGERPYPIFRLEDEKAVEEERILTHLLLEAIRDLLNDYGSIIGNSIANIQNKVGGRA